MYKKIPTFFLLILFACGCQTVMAVDTKKNQTTQKVKPVATSKATTKNDPGFSSSPYKPSGLLLDMDFETQKIQSLKGKNAYDKLVVKSPKGKTTALGIMYEGGKEGDRHARITADPENKENHVLHYWLKKALVPDQKKGKFKGRIQLNLADTNKTSVFQRYRLYLHPDLKYYSQYPARNTWFTINEFWMGAKWKKHPYPFRMGIHIAKPEGVGKPLYFVAEGAVAAGGALKKGRWKEVWGKVGSNFEVPLGEWIDVEIGYKQGDKNSGRLYMGVKREKDKQFTTIFDVTDWTYHPDSPKPVPLTDWQPLKVYTSSKIVDFVRNKGGVTQIYWDDIEIYDNW